MMRKDMTLTVNGSRHALAVEPHLSLLDLLREKLDLTGTKKGCNAGDCGACTVLLNGAPVNSCLILAVQADGQDITTIEGVAGEGELHPLQEAFIDHGAVQCGYCTPGVVLSAIALLRDTPQPTRSQIQEALSGNLCRCTGYFQIIDAIDAVARRQSEDSSRNLEKIP